MVNDKQEHLKQQEVHIQTGESLLDPNDKNERGKELNYFELDPFDEDLTEQRFFNQKPTCFLVIGKPGSGKSTMAKRLADEWKAELINPTDLIQQNMKKQTDLGKKAKALLLKGEAVPDSMVAQMINDKVNSPEVIHHGYVLVGFPSYCETSFDITKQMEMLKNFKLPPDFIINMRIGDQDLTKRRVFQKVDPITGNVYVKEMYAPEEVKPKKPAKSEWEEEEGEEEQEEEQEEELLEEQKDEFFAQVPNDVVERLVIRPEDTLPRVEESIKTYKQALLSVLEDHMASMDQSYLIELDGNVSPTILTKDLLLRLLSYNIRKAARPMRINEPITNEDNEEEVPSEPFVNPDEIEEAMVNLQVKRRLGANFKWRRSKCSYYCPVSLKNGRIVSGKPDFAATFLDKLYLMADEKSLQEFLKNPRPYLKLPQPRAPCKVSVLGTKLSGKTTLCSFLAKKYNANVIDLKQLVEPDMKKARTELLEKVRNETIEATTEQIKIKYKERLDQEKSKREQELAEKAAASAEAQQNAENQEGENLTADGTLLDAAQNNQTPDSTLPAQNSEESKLSETLNETTTESKEKFSDLSSLIDDKFVHLSESGAIVVHDDHPDIEVAVQKALEDAEKSPITLPVDIYIEALKRELERIQKERQKLDATALSEGGWILDNFPNTTDQLNAMAEHHLLPDSFITLDDASDSFNVLMRRWYSANRNEIDQKIQARLAQEELKRLEDQQKRAEEIKKSEFSLNVDEESSGERELVNTEEKSIKDEESKKESLEKILEEDESKDSHHGKLSSNSKVGEQTFKSEVEPPTPVKAVLPIKGPETQDYINSVKASIELIRNVTNAFNTLTGSEAASIEINKKVAGQHLDEIKNIEECCTEAAAAMEKVFKFTAVEFEGVEEAEAEEGEEEEEEGGGEEEQEEEDFDEEEEEDNFDPSLKEKNVHFGETNYFCPVALHKKNILIPGNPEYQCKYREKIYRFFNEQAKAEFMENPLTFLPHPRKRLEIPAPRFFILGARGSGKSTQARILADKLNIFHVKFRDYLQEMIMNKVKKIIEPEREEEKEDEEEDDDDDEEEKKLKAAKVEEPLPELTDKEETIKAYLEKDETLTPEILDEVLSQLWTEEPFKSRGFVLDGFPNNESQVQYLIDKGYFPDAVIVLRLDDEQVLNRLMPPRLQAWKLKQQAKKERKKQKADRKKEKLTKRMKERRDEEIAKYEERRREKEDEAAANGEEYEEEEFDVDALINEEFADELQEEEDVDEVQEDEVKENIMNDLRTHYENQISGIESVQEIFKESLIPRFTVDAHRKINIIKYLINEKLKRFVDYRQSLLERVYPCKLKMANKLVDFGYKHLSRFGRWCPVKLTKNEPVRPLYDYERKKPLPVIYRSYVYFLSSKDARKKFSVDPIKYLKQTSPLSVVPFKLSIIGPPKSGKTTLAARFATEYGCIRLSVGEAIRSVLEKQPDTELADLINMHLIRGKIVPDELAIQCIEVAIMDVKCQTNGFILDNYPVTKQQVKLMAERCIIPFKVIELKCEIKEIMQRCIRDRTNPDRLAQNIVLNDSPEIIGYKYREWKNEVNFIRDWYKNEHKNYEQLDGNQSKWFLWEQAKQLAFSSIRHVQIYIDRINQNKAACIAKLCVTYDEMLSRLGDFGQYCPVSLALNDELVDCSENRSMDFVAEFQGYYYKMFSETELKLFLEMPEKFVPPNAPRKLPPPQNLPKKRTPDEVKALFPKPIELKGYCPVTYFEGKQRYEAIEQGFIEYAAEYKNKLYYMASKEALDKFLRKPEQYSLLKLPHKLPPIKSPINVLNLPMTGYLEQTVAELLKKALCEVGTFKPKFPFLSATRSALLYIGYYLKAYNPKSSDFRRKKYKQKLQYFEQKCQLIESIYSKTTLKYKDPNKRSPEYNQNFENFFALKENVPTMNWLA